MATPDIPVQDRQAAQVRVLVVEDDPHIRELVLLHLGLEGFTTAASGDGAEALQLARTERYDLIVLDVMLPGLDGVTVCRAIRREPHLKDVPIMMLTARREESDKVNGLESGADDYLTKPFGIREFVARVRAPPRRRQRLGASRRRHRRRPARRSGAPPGPRRRTGRRSHRARIRSALRAGQ